MLTAFRVRALGATVLFYVVAAFLWKRPDLLLPSSTPQAAYPLAGLHRTHVDASAPGYSVISDIYWRNWTFYFVTDQPHSLPDLKLILTKGMYSNPDIQPNAPDSSIVVAIREEVAVVNSLDSAQKPVISMFPAEAMEEFSSDKVTVIKGTTLMCHDDGFVSHYYHWMGELFIGGWRIWTSYWASRNQPVPDFDLIAFPRLWSESEAPEGTHHNEAWEDPAGVNKWLMKTLYPNVEIQTRGLWAKRAASNKVFRFENMLLIDRMAGHRGGGPPSGKPFADVFRVPVPADYMLQLRDRAIAGHPDAAALARSGRGPQYRPAKPKVAYLSRQDTGRRLNADVHDRLVAELQALHDEGLVEFELLMFGKQIPFRDQVAGIAAVDFLVGVHGNGLTHGMWMNSGGQRAIIELQSKDCNYNDYAPLATAIGNQHFLVNGDQFCRPLDCVPRGCHGEFKSSHHTNIIIEPKLVSSIIRDLIAAWPRGPYDIAA
ncbi:hypothetical protein Q5752_000279 [Cryptotrichosporon argae]